MIKKMFSISICIALCASVFVSCSKTSTKMDMIYPFNGEINSFDPQVAGTKDEFLIAENCYEGLVRTTDDSSVKPGVAKSWNVSEDGKTYTFQLRQGAKWYINDKAKELIGESWNPDITAHDFVFALKRAASPQTESPLYSNISNIKGAPQINSEQKNASLAIKAKDDYTLEIKLSAPDSGFFDILSSAVAMPCNEEFFNATSGRYGLGIEYSIFNGQFYIKSQLESSFVLKASDTYVGEEKMKATDLTLNILNDERNEKLVKNIVDGYYDAAYISGKQFEQIENPQELTTIPYADTTWTFLINSKSGSLSEKKLRQALSMSLSKLDLNKSKFLSNATGITPPSCTIGKNPITSTDKNLAVENNPEKAKDLWRDGLKITGNNTINLTFITTEEMNDYAKLLAQGIQGSIGKISTYDNGKTIAFSFKIETVSINELETAIKKGEYDLALYPIKAASQSPVAFLDQISQENLVSSQSEKFENALKTAKSASADKAPNACIDAEKALIETYCVVPVFFESAYYVMAKNVKDVQFHPGSGRVSFVYAYRETK